MVLSLADILEALTGVKHPNASLNISEAAVDSRQVIPGGLFIPLPGERADGHDFVSDAFKRGASLAFINQELTDNLFPVVDIRSGFSGLSALPSAPFCLRVNDPLESLQKVAAFWRRKHNVRVIGITGSVGKSSTKELVADVLGQRYRTLRNPGNLNNEIGLPLTLLRLGAGYERVVLEMGFYFPGEITFLCDIALPSVGVVTNVGTVHAERAGSQEAIARGKAELPQAIPPAPEGTAILNYDDPWVRPMASQTKAKVVYYGISPEAHLWADDIEGLGLKGIRFQLHYGEETIHMRVPMIGRHSVHTILRATAVGLTEGLDWGEILTALQRSSSQLRLVTVRTENGALLLDDTYNASPESTLAALNLLSELQGRRVAVLGEMLELGQYEAAGHEMVGVRAAEVVDQLIAVGSRAQMIADAALRSGMPIGSVQWVATVPEATEALRSLLKAEDVVLVKGSHGLRMGRIIAALEAAS